MTEPDRSHRYKSLAFHGPSTHGGTAHPWGRDACLVRSLILSSFPRYPYATKKAGPGSMPGPDLTFRQRRRLRRWRSPVMSISHGSGGTR